MGVIDFFSYKAISTLFRFSSTRQHDSVERGLDRLAEWAERKAKEALRARRAGPPTARHAGRPSAMASSKRAAAVKDVDDEERKKMRPASSEEEDPPTTTGTSGKVGLGVGKKFTRVAVWFRR